MTGRPQIAQTSPWARTILRFFSYACWNDPSISGRYLFFVCIIVLRIETNEARCIRKEAPQEKTMRKPGAFMGCKYATNRIDESIMPGPRAQKKSRGYAGLCFLLSLILIIFFRTNRTGFLFEISFDRHPTCITVRISVSVKLDSRLLPCPSG